MRVLWLSPNLNHYKARFLNLLANEKGINLTVFSGKERVGQGDKQIFKNWNFDTQYISANKTNFGFSLQTFFLLKKHFEYFDWILIPAEKKNLFIFLFSIFLRFKAKKNNKLVRLISYNHPIIKSSFGNANYIDKLITKFYFSYLDRIIFYSQHSHNWAISKKIVKSSKAFWANNTVDDTQVNKYKLKRLKPLNPPSLLLIGRLIKYRWIDKLIEYYFDLKKKIPDLQLHIIGDGPEKYKLKNVLKNSNDIFLYGAIVDEKKISKIMNKVDYLFVPGHSGLSINHGFAYNKPYITSSEYPNHPPEYFYLKNRFNCLLLGSKKEKNIDLMFKYLTNRNLYMKLLDGVSKTKDEINISNWLSKMKEAFNHE